MKSCMRADEIESSSSCSSIDSSCNAEADVYTHCIGPFAEQMATAGREQGDEIYFLVRQRRMPRSRSRSPRGEFHRSMFIRLFTTWNLERYGSSRYRGSGTSNAPSNRRRNSRSRSPRDRDREPRGNDRTQRDRYPPRSDRTNKRYSRSRSASPKAFGNKAVDKRFEPIQRIFDRKFDH